MTLGTRMAVTVLAVFTVPLAACGGRDDSQMRATLTDEGCTYRGDKTARAGRFTIEVEDQTGHGGHFVLKELADGVTADAAKRTLDAQGQLAQLFKDAPVFFSDVVGDASGVLLADAPVGTYVLMCRRGAVRVGIPQFGALLEVTNSG